MIRFLWLSLLVVVLDQLSKHWVVASFEEFEVMYVLPVFNLTLVYNTGAAFSFLADAGGWQTYFFIGLALVVSVVLVVWMHRLQPHERLLGFALSLLLGGAIGNVIDRLLLGKVVDFLQWHWGPYYFPSFNLADSAIVLAMAFLLWDAFTSQKGPVSEKSDTA